MGEAGLWLYPASLYGEGVKRSVCFCPARIVVPCQAFKYVLLQAVALLTVLAEVKAAHLIFL